MTDFIGDIHGHAAKLEELLIKLGYRFENGSWGHTERKAFFVGDYIDRGPNIIRTLEIVKGMVDTGNAIALMGNHEYNALCFHTKQKDGGYLRNHGYKNVKQHIRTLVEFRNKQEEWGGYLEWFKTMPLFFETDSFRAVHACWDDQQIGCLRSFLKDDKLTDTLLFASAEKETPFNNAIESTLKGKEMEMPHGLTFTDKDKTIRREIRIKWWADPLTSTYRSISVEPLDYLPDTPIEPETLKTADFYNDKMKPVFFGHYWLKGEPILYEANICCLDYSVARQGYLLAYRFDGEKKLDNKKIVFV